MKRHDRVRVNYGDTWPLCVCYPTGKTGTVQEIIGDMAIVAVDDSAASTMVKLEYLEMIEVADETKVDMLDTEYTTPQQSAEIRRMKAELPLWQQCEAMEPFDFRQPAATTDATIDVVPHAIDCFSTEAPSQVQTDVDAPADVSSAYNPDYGKWADAVAQHRAINDTTGMESEE